MTDKSRDRMNLAAIKKVDPYAKDIVDSSAHVAFYTFNSAKNEWEKTDVEGSFFIYRRNAEPFHSIFINNRLNTTAFVEPITYQLEIQSQPPFLLYRNERSRIRGFWFYNSEECDRIGALINLLLQEPTDSKAKIIPKAVEAPMKMDSNIFNMLSKAQTDYYVQNMEKNNIASRNVINFFAAAKPTSSLELTNYPKIASNSLSVEQLEKQQRSKTPPDQPLSKSSALENLLNSVNINKSTETGRRLDFPPVAFPKDEILGLSFQPERLSYAESNKEETPYSVGLVKPALMLPTMFEKAAENNVSNKGHVPTDPLNYTQFVNAFTYLIKHDSGFMQKLHEAYLKTFPDL